MNSRVDRGVLGGLVLFFTVGVLGHLWSLTRPWMLWLTPWFLVFSGLAVVVLLAMESNNRFGFAGWIASCWAVTFAVEVAGVATGLIFGPYHYSDVLGTRLWGVPPVIGWNWVMVILGLHTLTRLWGRTIPEVVRVLMVGLGCVAFDLFLEPVATSLGYWVWDAPSIPGQNFVTWGLLGVCGAWWAGRVRSLPIRPLAGWYVILQWAFFGALLLAGVHP